MAGRRACAECAGHDVARLPLASDDRRVVHMCWAMLRPLAEAEAAGRRGVVLARLPASPGTPATGFVLDSVAAPLVVQPPGPQPGGLQPPSLQRCVADALQRYPVGREVWLVLHVEAEPRRVEVVRFRRPAAGTAPPVAIAPPPAVPLPPAGGDPHVAVFTADGAAPIEGSLALAAPRSVFWACAGELHEAGAPGEGPA